MISALSFITKLTSVGRWSASVQNKLHNSCFSLTYGVLDHVSQYLLQTYFSSNIKLT